MRISVIVTTYNRIDKLRRATASVLSQDRDLQLVVVDDGSTDDTRRYLENMVDPRVAVALRENGGPSAARNTGVARASCEWIAFLDDDDVLLPGWARMMESLIASNVGIICCGGEFRRPDGKQVEVVYPKTMGPLFENQPGNILAGSFLTRRSLIEAIEGYDESLMSSQQTDLWLRLIPAVREAGLTIRTTDKVLVQMEERPAHQRATKNPHILYHTAQVLLWKYSEKYASDPVRMANTYGIMGVSAARIGQWREARKALYRSVRADPLNGKRWLRLVLAHWPTAGRRVWRTRLFEAVEATSFPSRPKANEGGIGS